MTCWEYIRAELSIKPSSTSCTATTSCKRKASELEQNFCNPHAGENNEMCKALISWSRRNLSVCFPSGASAKRVSNLGYS